MRANKANIGTAAALGSCLSVLTFLSGPFLLFGPTAVSAQFLIEEIPVIQASVSVGGGDGSGGDGSGGDGSGGDGSGGDGSGGDGSGGDGSGGDGSGGDGSGGDGSGGDGSGGDGSGGDGSGGDGSGGDGSGGDGSGGDGSGGDGSGGDGSGGDGSGGDGSGGDGSGGDGSGGDGSGGDGSGGDGSGGDGSGGDGSGGDGSGGDGSGGDGSGGDGSGGDGSGGDGSGGDGSGGDGSGGDGSGGDGSGGGGSSSSGQGVLSSGGGPDGNENTTGRSNGADASAPTVAQSGTTFRTKRETGGPVVTVQGTGNPEVIVIGPARQAQAAVDALAQVGARFIRTKQLGSMGLQVLVFEYPRGREITAINEALSVAAPDMDAAYHNVYEFAQFAPRTYATDVVAPGAANGCRLPRNVRIGMIDGPVNAAHPALAGAKVRTHSLLSAQERSVGAAHGTGVAALMVGEDARGYLSGFAQGAELFSVAIFTSRLGGERTNVERIASALDYLLARDVRLINMSFTGPNNNVLRIVLEAASSAGAVMVAAVGTDGIPGGSLPAASDVVIGVTAVDARLRKFGAANSGPQVEFAAPGVDVYVAKNRRGGYATGTSFAAPIVTAIIADMTARGTRGLAQVRARLRANAQDLGTPGRDNTFGHGLVRASNC